MKNRFLLKLMLSGLFLVPIQTIRGQNNDTIPSNVQQRIYSAFLSCFETSSLDNLVLFERTLVVQKPSPKHSYWIAYAGYYKALFYLKTGKWEESGKALEMAVTAVDTVKNKSSELYALEAFLQSFSMRFSGNNLQDLSSKITQNAEKALELDSTNIRAWYILGNSDMYTPAAFGGGKKCEKYFLKAISLPEQSLPDSTMPSWGKSDAYSALVGYYIGSGNFDKAKKYLDEGLTLFPDDYMLNQRKEALKDK